MLFPGPFSADTIWNKIARATHAGELGIAAKIATNDNSGRSQVICIYTHDFTDLEDVKRGKCFVLLFFRNWFHGAADEVREEVLLNLRKLGLGKKRSISYKPGGHRFPRKSDRRLTGIERNIHKPWVIRTSRLLHLKYWKRVSYAARHLHIEGYSGKEMNELGCLTRKTLVKRKNGLAYLFCW